MTPHIRPLKSNIGHGRLRYSESEKGQIQSLDEEIPVFAYMRKSTSKKEQEESIEQQQEGIQHLSQELGINLKHVRIYSETKSGFENRSREEWKRMIKDIDATNMPCVLLCRDTSRLSRNPRDNLVIADRIFGDKNGNKRTKKTIGSIYFLGDNFQIQEWNERSDKKYIVDKLHQNYLESLETKTKSVNGHILKLQAGIYPYHPAPRGLEHIIVKGKKVLSQNDKMPFVRHAFEMKIERKGHKEITKYLKQFGGIKIGEKELTDRYFTNTVYIGEYTEKTTGQVFKNLLFAEGKPPISITLWDKVQKSLSKRGRVYRNESEKDIFEERGRIEGGGLLARDIKKKQTKKGESTYTYYKNTKAKVNIAQEKILKSFLEEIEKVLFLWGFPFVLKSLEEQRSFLLGNDIPSDFPSKNYLDLIKKEISLISKGPNAYLKEHKRLLETKSYATMHFRYFFYKIGQTKEQREEQINRAMNDSLDDVMKNLFEIHPEFKENKVFNEGIEALRFLVPIDVHKKEEAEVERDSELIRELFVNSPFFQQNKAMKKVMNQEISKLEQNKKNLEDQRKQYRKKAVLVDMNAEEIEEVTKDIDRSIRILEEEIQNLSESTDMEELLERLPTILTEIVELTLEALTEEENDKKKGNIIKLFEITVSNFSVSNKKELKIKLFEVLDALVNGDNVGMEAPAGVEPASRALQAPVGPFYQGAK